MSKEHLRMDSQYFKKEREANLKLMKQNKRYREVLERIEHYDTYAIDIEMASEMARKVRGSN